MAVISVQPQFGMSLKKGRKSGRVTLKMISLTQLTLELLLSRNTAATILFSLLPRLVDSPLLQMGTHVAQHCENVISHSGTSQQRRCSAAVLFPNFIIPFLTLQSFRDKQSYFTKLLQGE